MKRILICDDEPHIVEGLRFLLRGSDRTIVIARSGREALQKIQEAIPDLVIMDVMMPQMTGLEVVAELRSREATRDLPVIILTAKGEAQNGSVVEEVWHAQVLAKPFEPNMLREVVSRCLEAN